MHTDPWRALRDLYQADPYRNHMRLRFDNAESMIPQVYSDACFTLPFYGFNPKLSTFSSVDEERDSMMLFFDGVVRPRVK